MQINSSKSETFTDVIQNYRYTMNLILRYVQDVVRVHTDVHPNVLLMMRFIRECGPVSQHEIAVQLQISDAAISRQIMTLIKKGLISTKEDPTNRRKVLVDLTDEGRELIKKTDEIINAEFEDLLADVSEEDIIHLKASSEILRDHLVDEIDRKFL